MQPVFIAGNYNYINKIIFENNNYYIKLLGNVNISPSFNNTIINILCSPSYCNIYEYYTQLRISYNFTLQSNDYNKIDNKYLVIRCALKNDELIFIENNKYYFDHGKSVSDNEKDNNIANSEYQNIYFYNYCFINVDGYFNNFDTLHGSYHLIAEEVFKTYEEQQSIQKIHLAKIIFPNKIKIYTNIDTTNNIFYLDRVIPIKINAFGEFIYTNPSIIQSRHLLEKIDNTIQFIKKYDIRFIGIPQIIDNLYHQEIEFINKNHEPIDYILHTVVYIDEILSSSCKYLYTNNKYYIVCTYYLTNDVKYLYTKTTNYILSSNRENITPKNISVNDKTIKNDYVDYDYINEYLMQEINISKVYNLDYKYDLLDSSKNFILDYPEEYRINKINNNIFKINNNNNIITMYEPIDNDILETTYNTVKIDLFISNEFNTSNIINTNRLFNNIKQLRVKLLDLSRSIKPIYLLNYIKPWDSWSLLNAINKVPKLSELVNNIYLKWDNQVIQMNDNLVNYSYLTNNEVVKITEFLKLVETNNIAKYNFIKLKAIETLIFNNLEKWFSSSHFFFNVIDNINKFLYYSGYTDATFNGDYIVFNNDPNPLLYNGELAGYISNEYIYNQINKIVYRPVANYSQINQQINNWVTHNYIKDTFGIDINKLLKYITLLGNELKELYYNFTDLTSEYIYNNPLKFIINKLWDKYYKSADVYKNIDYNNLSKNAINELAIIYNYTVTNNIYSGLQYDNNLNIKYSGLNTYNYYVPFKYDPNIELNISDLTVYEPNTIQIVNVQNELKINPLYPFTIVFKKNEIITNATYTIDYLNGVNIANNITVEEPILYPDQLNFYSEYNIKPTDFLVVKQNKNYSIKSFELLGYKFKIYLNVNIGYIDQIYFRNYYLTIETKYNNSIDVLIPLSNNEIVNLFRLNSNDTFQIRNSIGIININIIDNKQYLEFYNDKFNYITSNTLLKTNNNLYQLNYDAILNKYYIIGNPIDSFDVLIITSAISSNIESLNNVLYQIELTESIINPLYLPIDNNYLIPLEFSLVNDSKSIYISPTKINTIDGTKLILYFTINDSFYINNSNAIYYYFSNNTEISYSTSSLIYLYDSSTNDIDIPNHIYEPTIDKTNKTANNIFILNNNIYITALINYSNVIELNKNINYIVLNKWTITDFSYYNEYIVFDKPDDLLLKDSSNNYYYLINDNIPVSLIVDINLINGSIYLPINTTLTGSFIFKQYWINKDEKSLTRIYNNETISWKYIDHNKKLGQNLINKINNIEKLDEYLYYFNLVINKTESTTIYLYNTTNSDIDISTGIFEPTIDTINKTSVYIQQYDTLTMFSIKNNYSLSQLADFSFIQKNSWNITSYTLELGYIIFKIPDDFIFINSSNYYYKINNTVINPNNIIIYNGFIKITGSFSGSIIFKQYYISTENIVNIPEKNRKVKIICDYSYQYDPTDKFYIIPYTSSGQELKERLYKMETSLTTTLSGFGGAINDSNNIINLYSQFGTKYNGIIFDKYYESTKVYYIISLAEILDTFIIYTFSLDDNIVKNVISINPYQMSLNFADYYYQDSSNYIYLFINDSINNYFVVDQIDKPTKFYLVSYEDYQINNLYYDYTFKQNEHMKKIITYNNSQNTIIEVPKWNRATDLFNYIRLFFGDQMLEEINSDTSAFKYYLNLSEDKRKQIDEMVKIKFNGNKWELYIPLLFWFANNPGLSIPIIALPHTELRLTYKLNDIVNCLSNDLSSNYTFNNTPQIRLTLINDYILLDLDERKLFGSYSHEYVINRFKTYESNYINSTSNVVVKQLTGLVKDIYLVTKPVDSTLTYYQDITNDYDVRYNRYVNAVNYYNLFSINNTFTSDEQRDYSEDIQIVKSNLTELNNYQKLSNPTSFTRINRLIDNFNGHRLWDSSNELLKMLMFMEDKFMTALSDSRKVYVLTMYLQYMYKNKQIIEQISPLSTLTIKANGTELFSPREWIYFNSVIPNQKFKNSLPMGYYVYSFSLYPNDEQYSGHLNFTNFDDIVFKITSEDRVNVEPYNLHTLVKEYNILRIMSGMGSLAWID